MYDYMKALQRQFETKPRWMQELSAEVDRTHRELSSRLAKEDRKLLLRLVDMEDNLRCHATQHSFVCGYRLACGIHREITEDPHIPSPERKKNGPAEKRRPMTRLTQKLIIPESKQNPIGGDKHGKTKAIR